MEEPALRNDDDRIVFGFLFDKPVVRIAAVGTAVAVGQDESERGGAAVGRDDVCRPAFFFADDVEERAQMGGMRIADDQNFRFLVCRADGAIGFGQRVRANFAFIGFVQTAFKTRRVWRSSGRLSRESAARNKPPCSI